MLRQKKTRELGLEIEVEELGKLLRGSLAVAAVLIFVVLLVVTILGIMEWEIALKIENEESTLVVEQQIFS